VQRYWTRRTGIIVLLTFGLILAVAITRTGASPAGPTPAAQEAAKRVSIDADDIGGVVTDSKGPEAGVWVIAETTELPTKVRKIVVTDDGGRYLLPQLPKATYKVWVRGYGLVDSKPVESTPGHALALTAVIAPDAMSAAQYYPADYWYSLLNIPPKSAFPLKGSDLKNQAEYVYYVKRGCSVCHQMGTKMIREIEPNLGTFDSPSLAWDRRIQSGQDGFRMKITMDRFGHDRGLAMFADWTNRIVSTNELNPTENGYGMVYASDFLSGELWALNLKDNSKTMIRVPVRNEADRKLMTPSMPQNELAASPVWGNELIWNDTNYIGMPHMDSKGRIWLHAQTRPGVSDYCKKGSGNPFAENFPMPNDWYPRDLDNYDPKTGKFELIDLCLSAGHMAFGNDKDETLYFTGTNAVPPRMGGIGWIHTRIWDETHDVQKSMGWCPAVIDYNGDGKTGAYTKPDEAIDPKLDRAVDGGNGYGFSFDQADGSIWYAGLSSPVPGRIIRMTVGDNPPATCKTEVYEPPFDNPKRPGVEAFGTLGLAVDTNGIVWAALTGSADLASFDRRKCKGPLNGPKATGQQCPEGWTLYPVPSPKFKGTTVSADHFYHNWVDRYDTLGLGKNVPIVDGTGADSLIAFLPETKKFITMRVPYPLDFYTRNMEGRIDDPKAGWKGRGLWTGNEEKVIWNLEGGKGNTTSIAHFQMRPDPLAK
jgi:hypothetical protein